MGYYDWYKEQKELAHHGILGQKWGIRRFQNKNGSLTIAGKQRYQNNLDQADADAQARKAAKADGLDQGDNYKVYRAAMAGDENAKQIIESWKKSDTQKTIEKKMKENGYGGYDFKTKDGLNVTIDTDEWNPKTRNYEQVSEEKKQELVKGTAEVIDYFSNENNADNLKTTIAKEIASSNWNEDEIPVKDIKNNLKMYHLRVSDVKGDNVYVETSYEHEDMWADSAVYSDHSIDYEGVYDKKTKDFKVGSHSING